MFLSLPRWEPKLPLERSAGSVRRTQPPNTSTTPVHRPSSALAADYSHHDAWAALHFVSRFLLVCVFQNSEILKENIVASCARIYLFVRQPLAGGGAHGWYTYSNKQRRVALALGVTLVVYRPNLIIAG
jgi:hypothetical protein